MHTSLIAYSYAANETSQQGASLLLIYTEFTPFILFLMKIKPFIISCLSCSSNDLIYGQVRVMGIYSLHRVYFAKINSFYETPCKNMLCKMKLENDAVTELERFLNGQYMIIFQRYFRCYVLSQDAIKDWVVVTLFMQKGFCYLKSHYE